MSDARFEDGEEAPLRLMAQEAGDLGVMAALVQDAVLPASDMTWSRRQHRFALLLNRFRHEDRAAALREGRPFERVRSLLVFDNVLAVRAQGISRDPDVVVSLLEIAFTPLEEGAGLVRLVFAGDGAVELSVDALEVVLTDVSRPYKAVSGKAPSHD
ncbi:DUF2948 family protein [Stagnihabitans tardus]|uniref:DUF2948 family protein n=1 Tax=Stagnihabitans tardus TaxID=2699202 RepID=A0AAE5BTN5_9RHOB|nr:DUF2948 family protein [Stagnihabitans tardus]NBZ86901.1 DUF2948 family protein [Stagnihabitans tardus]